MSPEKIDALEAITQDLTALGREKRRHFAPALLLAMAVVVAGLVMMGVRPDLLSQPPWQVGIQIVLWVLCLVVFPAVGLGLIFPGRSARICLALAGVAIMVLASVGWPQGLGALGTGAVDFGSAVGGCLMLVVGSGILLVAVGVLSGAFVQRRRTSAVYWVVAGLSLAALNLSTWVCPNTDLVHVFVSHLGGTALLLGLALIVATVAHRWQRA